jgi:5-formyltetrahydrofolate cyclo-ligase
LVAPEVRSSASTHAAQHLAASDLFNKSALISCYLARENEFETSAIISTIWQAKKNCYLPVMMQDKNHLQFALYNQDDTLKLGRFGIQEPAEHKDLIKPSELEIVILPVWGFDLAGHRLGSGGGFYDRTFEFKKSGAKHPLLIGLAYQQQEILALPYDEWDVNLDGILTEKAFTLF